MVRRYAGLVQKGTVAGLTMPAYGYKVFASARLAKKAGAHGIAVVFRRRTGAGTFCAWFLVGHSSPIVTQ